MLKRMRHSGHMRCIPGIAAVVCLIVLCGCAQKKQGGPQQVPGDAPYYRFTDSAGVDISLQKKPEKVAVLFSSFAEIWQLAGGTVAISVGESAERGFTDDGIPVVDDGAGKTINTELLLSNQPDLVICSADIAAQRETASLLAAQGIPAAQFRVESFEDYLQVLKICTEITGNPQAYRTYGEDIRAQVAAVLETAKSYSAGTQKEILFIRAGSGYNATKAKTAQDNFVCQMLNELGTYNIAENAPVLLDGLSLEEILTEDPEYIFFSFMGKEEAAKAYVESLLKEDSWKSLTAVKNGNYTFLPKELFHFKPNARWAEAYRYLLELLYPDAAGATRR